MANSHRSADKKPHDNKSGIQFALGWQREDSSAKTNGINTIIAGALVLAISVACRTFLN